jgi:hypothetical protein
MNGEIKMKKIIGMSKDSDNVFVMDNDNYELNLGDEMELSTYEEANNVEVNNMIIDYLSNIDNTSPIVKKGFDLIIKDIESILEQKPIAEGKVLGEDDDTISIVFNLSNPFSNIDCELRVFCHNYKNRNNLDIMINFSKGAGFNYGFNFFKYFDNDEYIEDIKYTLIQYLSVRNSKDDKKLINNIIKSIQKDMITEFDY